MRRLARPLLLLALATATGASQTTTRHLDVPVGGVAEADVDTKIGYACDDTSILRAHLETRGNRNWFVVEGIAAGRTLCRVGLPQLPTYLFDVQVHP